MQFADDEVRRERDIFEDLEVETLVVLRRPGKRTPLSEDDPGPVMGAELARINDAAS